MILDRIDYFKGFLYKFLPFFYPLHNFDLLGFPLCCTVTQAFKNVHTQTVKHFLVFYHFEEVLSISKL